MHRQKQELLITILSSFGQKRDFAPTLLAIVKDQDTPTTVFDLILAFINRIRNRINAKHEIRELLQSIAYELA